MGITEIFLNYYQYFLRGTQTTVIVSLITVLLGTVLGCLIALLRLSRFRLCSGFAKLYITVIRGTPLLVQLYIVYYQLHFIPWPEGSILGVELARVMPCILALSLGEYRSATAAVATGIRIPPPRPCMARHTISISMLVDIPANMDPTTKRVSPMRNRGFLP